MPGGKGVNIARAIKRLGQPVIATGLAGGATGTRIVEALTDESILNASSGSARSRGRTPPCSTRRPGSTPRSTSAARRSPPQELELFRDKLLYLANGASICVFAGSLPRGIEPDIYAALIRDVRKLGVTTIIDTDGEPLRLAMRAEPDVVSPNELEAEELVGHEFNDDDDRAQAVAEIARLGAGEAIMTVPDGCYAQVLDDGAPRLYRVRVEEQEARSTIGSGDAFLAGYVAARYARPDAGRVPALRRRLRRRVDAALRRRHPRPRRGRAAARRGRGRAARARRPRSAEASPRPAVAARRVAPGLEPPRMADRLDGTVGVLPPPSRPSAPTSYDFVQWKSRSDAEKRPGGRTGSTTSRSCPRGARATPMTSTSPGRSARTGSSCRCWRRRSTASSRPRRPGIIGKLGGLAVLNLEGIFSPLRGRREQLERIADLLARHRDARDAGHLPRAGQARADRPADQGDQGPGRRRRGVADAAEGARATTRSRSRPGSTSS